MHTNLNILEYESQQDDYIVLCWLMEAKTLHCKKNCMTKDDAINMTYVLLFLKKNILGSLKIWEYMADVKDEAILGF